MNKESVISVDDFWINDFVLKTVFTTYLMDCFKCFMWASSHFLIDGIRKIEAKKDKKGPKAKANILFSFQLKEVEGLKILIYSF